VRSVRRLSYAVPIVLSSAIAGLPLEQVFRTGVSVLPIYVVARDTSGRLVTDLNESDFDVEVDGRSTEVLAFSRVRQPLSLALMLDTSLSVHAVGSDVRMEPVLAFLRKLAPDDRVSLGTFGAQISVGHLLPAGSSQFERILREEVWVGGGTPLWQALDEAVQSLSAQANRRVVVVYTDGQDTGSLPGWTGGANTVERNAAKQNCMIYVVQPLQPTARRLPSQLERLVASTGGGHLALRPHEDLADLFAGLLSELRQQYLVGIAPPNQASDKLRIRVTVKRPGVVVRARTR
jgi:VWFA-related protein